MTKHGNPKVALLIETARGYGRGVLRGIVRYSRLNGPWSFYLTPGDFEQVVPKMRHWGCTGIIARIATPKVAKAILDCGLPTIALDLSNEELQPGNPLAKFSEIASDSYRAAQMAAEHLLDRKFPHYAFVGTAGRVWSDRRLESFCADCRGGISAARVLDPAQKARSSLGSGTVDPRGLAEGIAYAAGIDGLQR